MKISLPFSTLFQSGRNKRPNSGRVAFVHWDRETIDYLIVSPNSHKLAAHDVGSVSRADHANPLRALSEYYQQHQLNVGRLVVLLSRPELDQLLLDLPPAEAFEIPTLVAAAVEQQLGEADQTPRVDYLSPIATEAGETETTSRQVLAFAISAAEFNNLETQVNSAGFRLAAIASRHLAPLGVLNRRTIPRDTLTVSIHVYAAEVELIICRQHQPLLLRSIRINPDEPARVAEQIWLETQRCLTLLPEELNAQPMGWCIFSNSDFAWQVSRSLEDRGLSVQTIDPFLGWEIAPRIASRAPGTDEDGSQALKVEAYRAGASAANTGAAWEFLKGTLPVNLLEPKRAPVPPNPWIRWGSIAAAAVTALAVGVWFMLSDVRVLEVEADDLQRQLADAKKITAKYQAKADQVAYVETWLSDQVDWLSELEQLSQRLPQGQNATVRRLTAGTVDRNAVFDLSVQVAQQEHISALESGIRSAKYATSSKSINQKLDESEYPWQFETRISFAIEPPDPKSYAPANATGVAKETPSRSESVVETVSTESESKPTPNELEPVEAASPESPPAEIAESESAAATATPVSTTTKEPQS